MATSVWDLGALDSTITFNKTNAEMAALLEWLIVDKTPPDGLTQAQLNQWKLNQAHKVGMQAVMAKIRENQAVFAGNEEQAAYRQSIQARLAAIRDATGIVDEDDDGPGVPPIMPM